jgi:hypothetical protein
MENIAKAFVKAQAAFAPALKDSDNPYFKSKYADLATCVKAVIDALHENNIALIQNCHESDDGVIVETIFLHESGESISCGKLSVPAAKNDPQGYGSALTYARRYSLMAACGIAPEDDDGNAASRPKKDQKPVDTSFAVKALDAASKKGTKELRKAWESQPEEVRIALTDKLAGWKSVAAKHDADIAMQA